MTKTSFYERYKLLPDSGNVVTSWGAIQPSTGRYLFQCWDNEKTFIKKEASLEFQVGGFGGVLAVARGQGRAQPGAANP
jgi:hypothetical protein